MIPEVVNGRPVRSDALMVERTSRRQEPMASDSSLCAMVLWKPRVCLDCPATVDGGGGLSLPAVDGVTVMEGWARRRRRFRWYVAVRL